MYSIGLLSTLIHSFIDKSYVVKDERNEYLIFDLGFFKFNFLPHCKTKSYMAHKFFKWVPGILKEICVVLITGELSFLQEHNDIL